MPYLTPTDDRDDRPRPGGADRLDPHPDARRDHRHRFRRAVPDVSADADPYTGYLLYSPAFAQAGDPVLEGGWGGTSFVAPQMNGSTAVIDSALGHRVGFWNPSIYAVARSSGSLFNPLDAASASNDNLFYTGNPGEPYNQGVGLGIPNLTALSADFDH